MTLIGFSGHQDIPDAAFDYVEQHLRREIALQSAPTTGYCSLAAGADQLFAKLIIEGGGLLHVVIPSEGYDTTFDEKERDEYERLLNAASVVEQLRYPDPDERAYDAAGRLIARECDVMFAVWDGEPSRGLGGTADAVAYAKREGKPVIVIWPEGIKRD